MAAIFVLTLGALSPWLSEQCTAATSYRIAPFASLCGAPTENATLSPPMRPLCTGAVTAVLTPERCAILRARALVSHARDRHTQWN